MRAMSMLAMPVPASGDPPSPLVSFAGQIGAGEPASSSHRVPSVPVQALKSPANIGPVLNELPIGLVNVIVHPNVFQRAEERIPMACEAAVARFPRHRRVRKVPFLTARTFGWPLARATNW